MALFDDIASDLSTVVDGTESVTVVLNGHGSTELTVSNALKRAITRDEAGALGLLTGQATVWHIENSQLDQSITSGTDELVIFASGDTVGAVDNLLLEDGTELELEAATDTDVFDISEGDVIKENSGQNQWIVNTVQLQTGDTRWRCLCNRLEDYS